MEEPNDTQNALLFVPDISGFTQFINDRQIQHNHRIIAELLEILIESNRLNLKVNEIEGDAILFYRVGQPPRSSRLHPARPAARSARLSPEPASISHRDAGPRLADPS